MKNKQIASKGIAIGKAFIYQDEGFDVPKNKTKDVKKEKEKLKDALKKSSDDIKKIKEKSEANLKQNADIFDAHLEMINDPELIKQTEAMIENETLAAETAYDKVADQYIEIFKNMDDPYFKERAGDIKDIKNRVLAYLLGKTPKTNIKTAQEDTILIAKDLAPSDTATLDFDYVKGMITEMGGTTSHTAIMSRALNIPAIVGAKGLIEKIKSGDTIALDALNNNIIINPKQTELDKLKAQQKDWQAHLKTLNKYIDKPTKTKDDHQIPLFANIGNAEEAKNLKDVGAEGVGLFRTEFLFMQSAEAPDLKTQIKAYQTVFETIQPVIIRTVDIGGDKDIPYLKLDKEENPFLGVRGIRLALQEKELFKTQLKALLIAAKDQDDLRIMLPMVATINEIKKSKAILNEVKKALKKDKKAFQDNIKLGIMIEVPAAALNAFELAKHVDFFSIGTNDLIQYLFAADRTNENLSHLYEPYDPTLLSTISRIIQAGHQEDIPVGLCGEIASKLDLALILTGLGIDELSMSPTSILEIRKTLASLNITDLRTLAQAILKAKDAKDVKKLIKQFKDDNL